MDEAVKRENIVFRIKQLLQDKGIKLWLPPYYGQEKEISDLGITDQILEIAAQYYEMLNVDPQICAEIILDVQIKSLQRLKERELFKTEGLATIRVKVSGQSISEFSVHLQLSSLCDDLKKSIAEQTNISAERLKLIAAGKVLKFDQTLQQQMIKHGSTVLAMVLPSVGNDSSNAVDNVDEKILYETKKDLEFLTDKSKKNNLISVTDQAGHFLSIPESSRTSLLTAMTLHEKGRSAFKRNTYSLALVFYLEADNEFKSCKSDLLDKVDNYALLNLDIVWCYLHLQSFHYLSDAEARLKICDETFKRCYGSNLERLVALKGTSGNESVLLVRLHLLQAILHHLQNRKDAAIKMFEQVESEIQKLKVDEGKALDLMTTLNCTLKEARLGLRASFNDANAAYEFIHKQREQKKRSQTVEKLRARTTDDCICGNGACVDAETVTQLSEMGYSQLISIAALITTNNNLQGAIMWINNFSQNLRSLYTPMVADVILSIDITSRKYLTIFRAHKYQLNEKCIADLVTASIGAEQAAELFPNFTTPVAQEILETVFSNALPSGSSSTQIPSTSQEATFQNIRKTAEKLANELGSDFLLEEEENACKRLKEDLSDTTDDYLDTTLESEEKFLAMYKSLL